MATFSTLKYQTDSGELCKIRVAANRVVEVGAPPAGALADDARTVKLSKSSSAFGTRPRHLLLYQLIGTQPNTVRKYTRLPQLTAAVMAAVALESVVTIDAVQWRVANKIGEDND